MQRWAGNRYSGKTEKRRRLTDRRQYKLGRKFLSCTVLIKICNFLLAGGFEARRSQRVGVKDISVLCVSIFFAAGLVDALAYALAPSPISVTKIYEELSFCFTLAFPSQLGQVTPADCRYNLPTCQKEYRSTKP